MYNKNLNKMNKETLRMQMLAGIITEGEYKTFVNDPNESQEDISVTRTHAYDVGLGISHAYFNDGTVLKFYPYESDLKGSRFIKGGEGKDINVYIDALRSYNEEF
jgi:hypothetical protein